MRMFTKIILITYLVLYGHRSILWTPEVSLFFSASIISFILCTRHHGETPAVCRCLSELLWISPGGQYVALSAASLYCQSGGHQHTSTLLRPTVSPPGQPQHCSGGETKRHVMWFHWSWSFFRCKWNVISCFVLVGSGYMPLGHMLTFRVAYQIAAGLAYLHRKSIIFCDLKSDNILVWSLEVCIWLTEKTNFFCTSNNLW